MPTEQEIGQEIGLLLHAHGCASAEHPDLLAALTLYAYRLMCDAVQEEARTLTTLIAESMNRRTR